MKRYKTNLVHSGTKICWKCAQDNKTREKIERFCEICSVEFECL